MSKSLHESLTELNEAYNKLWDEINKAVTIPILDFIVRIVNKFKR